MFKGVFVTERVKGQEVMEGTESGAVSNRIR